MSIFNPDTFLSSSIETPLSTERLLVPAGEYAAHVTDVKVKSGTVSKGENAGKPWARLDVVWEFDDDNLRTQLNQSKIVRTQGVMLDLADDGSFDTRPGRNIALGRLLKAFGLNQAGTSPSALIGRFGKVRVVTGEYQGNPTDEIREVLAA